MTIPSRISATPAAEPAPAATAQEAAKHVFGEIRFPALKGVIAGSAAVRAARNPQPKERELPPILRKGAFED